jgi:hypothetical protein
MGDGFVTEAECELAAREDLFERLASARPGRDVRAAWRGQVGGSERRMNRRTWPSSRQSRFWPTRGATQSRGRDLAHSARGAQACGRGSA